MAMQSVLTTDRQEDERIQRDVLAELKWDARIQSNKLGVAVEGRVVTLTGQVDSYAKRWAAEGAALRVKGVRAVANEIEVQLGSSSERTDADIAAAALRALEWDAVVPADKVQVAVSNGWVTLTGELDWYHQRQDAERVVRRLTGVKGVINLSGVKPKPTLSDLKQKIEEALIRSAKTDAQNIQVDVHAGKVILRGMVRSWAESDAAQHAAWLAPGVTAVDNRLVIYPEVDL